MKKGLILLITGSLLLTGCNIANADISSSETMSDSISYLSESYEMNTVAINDTIDYINQDYIDNKKKEATAAIIPPKEDFSELWDNESIRPFSFSGNVNINIFLPSKTKDEELTLVSVVNKYYIKKIMDNYVAFRGKDSDNYIFDNALINYSEDDFTGILIRDILELYAFSIDKKYESIITEAVVDNDICYKLGEMDDKIYFLLLRPDSVFLHGHGYISPLYFDFVNDYFDKICNTAYVTNINYY